jgi:dTDP-4-amino-4,6-dideoxygalactose transaminase
MEVPFAKPYLRGDEGQRVAEVISTGWVSQGPRVREFEAEFARAVGANDAVATSNCTTALQLALYVEGVGYGDEVIVPSMSFIASANSAWQNGATPVFADVDRRTYNVTAETIRPLITSRTKAIMPVHQLGLPADMDPILELAAEHGIAVVEDAACAIGASYKGRKIGSLGPLTCFSLHPRKVITTGEGGMIAVQDPEVAARLRRLRQHGMDVSDLARHGAKDVIIESYPERGWNVRMTDMQAMLGLCQLEELDYIRSERARVAVRYNEAFASNPFIEPPFDPEYADRTWQTYAVQLSDDAPVSTPELMRLLLKDGVPTRRGVMASHKEPSYAGSTAVLPETDWASTHSIMLPLFVGMTDEQQDHVIAAVSGHLAAVSV